MKKKYHLEYDETEQTFADMYEVFYNDRSYYFYNMFIIIIGCLTLFIQISVDHSKLAVMYIISFVLLWVLVYIAGCFFVKKVIAKKNIKHAIKAGKNKFKVRKEKCGDNLKIKINFYEDKFTVIFQDNEKEYSYKEITRMRANERFFGMVLGGVYGDKVMVGFPAAALQGIDKEGFLRFVEIKSTNVAGGFKQVNHLFSFL